MKKRLIGGLVLLNLCNLSLELSEEPVEITDKDVLKQLTELRSFIDEKRDFLNMGKDLKPIVVQYKSSADAYCTTVQCNMVFDTDYLHMVIGGKSVLKDGNDVMLKIDIEFEYTDYVGYTIKKATMLLTSVLHVDSQFEMATIDYSSADSSYMINDSEVLKSGQIVQLFITNTNTSRDSVFSLGFVKYDSEKDEFIIYCTPFVVEDDNQDLLSVTNIVIDNANQKVKFKAFNDTFIDVDTSFIDSIRIVYLFN